jgi:MSHA biogenesis protein MshE
MSEARAAPKKIRIGDLLISHGLINEAQLKQALDQQKLTGARLGKALIDLGHVEEDSLLKLIAEQLNCPFVQLRNYQFDSALTQRLPETFARRFRALILAEKDGGYLIGMTDPMDLFAFDEIGRVLNASLQLAVVRESELLDTLDIVYRRTGEILQIAETLEDELGQDAFDIQQIDTAAEDAPVMRLLQTIFEDAVQVKTSDIHIEPDETVLRIRQRIDGVLQEQVMKEKRIASALVLRLKLMASLDISERRLPQDGRFNIKLKNRNVDVRISTLPTQHGESVVMRLLDQSEGGVDLEKSGMPAPILSRFRQLIHLPHGLVLVTGPTGSGKTTTLYGALRELNLPQKKIITVEDPVEYRLPRISQVQVHEKIGLNFATVLRACLRQDPDILLVGEIRDRETAEIALRASMTGHLVLSTLHTNDAVSSAMRFLDIGLEGYLVASSLKGVIAQRLVRRICQSCTQPYEPTRQDQIMLEGILGYPIKAHGFHKGRGCPHCNNTGYRGRVGVFELLEITPPLADALRRQDTSLFASEARNQPGFSSLAVCALEYAARGATSLDEVFRLAEHVHEEEALLEEASGLDGPAVGA